MNINLTDARTIVVKIGTTLLSGPSGFDGTVLEGLVREIAIVKRARDMNILVVSSGALGCGMSALGFSDRPRLLPLKQATAAVGQSRLMHHYELLFETHGAGLHVAQVLITGADLDNRHSYLNIRNTIQTLFSLKSIVPIINENDSVATEELKFGDNDTLAAKVAGKIDADLLIILSDVDGLYDKNPAKHANATLVEHVERVTDKVEALADGTATQTSIGGMVTKLAAAKIANSVGLPMVIANGRRPGILDAILNGTARCTSFGKHSAAMPHRKRWIAFGRAVRGALRIDDGAKKALINQGKSLLAAGITSVSGEFEMGAAVRITDQRGRVIASGLVNYSSDEIARIKGRKSGEIQAILGRKDFDEVVHRDNLVLLDGETS